MLLPSWQAPEGGDLGAGAGTSATWIAPANGTYNLILIVSDGERRFGRKLAIEVKEGNEPSPTPPPATFPPEESPTPTPEGTGEPTATPTPKPGALSIQVGKRADGDDPDALFEDPETATIGSEVTFRVVIDNDSAVPVTIDSILDDLVASLHCDAVGGTLEADDGDAEIVSDSGPDSAVCTYTVTVTAADAPQMINRVTVGVSDADSNTASDSDTATVNIS